MDWLIDWLIDWLTDWLTDWLIDWSFPKPSNARGASWTQQWSHPLWTTNHLGLQGPLADKTHRQTPYKVPPPPPKLTPKNGGLDLPKLTPKGEHLLMFADGISEKHLLLCESKGFFSAHQSRPKTPLQRKKTPSSRLAKLADACNLRILHLRAGRSF